MIILSYITDICLNSRKAFNSFNLILNEKLVNNILKNIIKNLKLNIDKIIIENYKDIKNFKLYSDNNKLLDRLILDKERILNICNSIEKIIKLNIPFNKIISKSYLDNGLEIIKKSVPFGVISMIYESRPNVTIEASCLLIKSGNCAILKGGKESIFTNICLINIIKDSITQLDCDPNIISFIEDNSRENTNQLIKLDKYIDLIIPRGNHSLIKFIKENSTIPLIETGTGNCHIYIDYTYDLDIALNVIKNSKTSRPSVCNSAESLLVNRHTFKSIIPIIYKSLSESKVKFYCCNLSYNILKNESNVFQASDQDYYKEFLDYSISLKVVDNIDEAINHINKYGTKHSECIITNDTKNRDAFFNLVDSSTIYLNASTRFTDGEVFGFGSEIGISTQKLHARGPMSLSELNTYKYLVIGDGQIRK